jgi:uncharacterized membrane protein
MNRTKLRGGGEILVGFVILLISFTTGMAGGGAFLAVGMIVALVLMGVGVSHVIGEPAAD